MPISKPYLSTAVGLRYPSISQSVISHIRHQLFNAIISVSVVGSHIRRHVATSNERQVRGSH